jgi:hypothetical protein
VATGTGLVLEVTPPVKPVTSPITPAEKVCTPLTIDAAKDPPGRVGREVPEEDLPPPIEPAEIGAAVPPKLEGWYPGS